MLEPLYSLGILLVVTALVVAGISRLKYLRRSYGSPSLEPLGVPVGPKSQAAPSAYPYGAAAGDGGAQAVNLFASDGFLSLTDEAIEEAKLLAAKQQLRASGEAPRAQ